MQISILFLLFIFGQTWSINNETNKQSKENGSKIIGGSKVPIEEIPYQVSIRIRCDEEVSQGAGFICGGSLISQRAVLTAAHCLFKKGPSYIVFKVPPNAIVLVMGNTYLYENSSTEKKYSVADIKIHSLYDGHIINDIAMLFIDGVVKLSSTVQLIELNTFPIKSGTMCQASGWGKTETGGNSNELRRLEVPIHDANVCLESFFSFNKQSQVCAGNMNSSNGACHGDSGGPLVCNGVLVGIASFVYITCANFDKPDFYTNVAFFYDWIKAQNKTFNKKRRAKSMADSLVSFDRCCFIFALLAVLLHEAVY